MSQQIINEITNLKRNYQNNNNTYEVQYLEITEEIFMNKLKNITKQKWDSIKITDDKEYNSNGMVLNIDPKGEMKCVNKRMLKYKYINNVRINLFNERPTNSENFNIPKTNKYGKYDNNDSVYKQKKMVFSKNTFDLMMIIKTDNDKTTTYEMNIVFKSSTDENKLNDIFKIL